MKLVEIPFDFAPFPQNLHRLSKESSCFVSTGNLPFLFTLDTSFLHSSVSSVNAVSYETDNTDPVYLIRPFTIQQPSSSAEVKSFRPTTTLLIVLTFHGNMQIFDKDGNLRMFIGSLEQDGSSARGTCFAYIPHIHTTSQTEQPESCLLFIGLDSGYLQILKATLNGRRISIEHESKVKIGRFANDIVNIFVFSTSCCRYLVSLHSYGSLRLWKVVNSSVNRENVLERMDELKGDGQPLTCGQAVTCEQTDNGRYDDTCLIFVGSSTGSLQIYKIFENKFKLVAQINAHAGWITALDILQISNDCVMCASIAEDHFIQVFKISTTPQLAISHIQSQYIPSILPYGLQISYLDGKEVEIIVAGYGSQSILSLKIPLTCFD